MFKSTFPHYVCVYSNNSIKLLEYIYIYIYIYMCVCVYLYNESKIVESNNDNEKFGKNLNKLLPLTNFTL